MVEDVTNPGSPREYSSSCTSYCQSGGYCPSYCEEACEGRGGGGGGVIIDGHQPGRNPNEGKGYGGGGGRWNRGGAPGAVVILTGIP